MGVTQFALTWTGWPNELASTSRCKIDLHQSEYKSTQVHASPGQTVSQVDPSFQLAPACESAWPGLYRVAHFKVSARSSLSHTKAN